jgi:hypothetical protein
VAFSYLHLTYKSPYGVSNYKRSSRKIRSNNKESSPVFGGGILGRKGFGRKIPFGRRQQSLINFPLSHGHKSLSMIKGVEVAIKKPIHT